jgi:anaerobic ribonucleoside-triphosphate reductase activating protein
MLRYNNYDIVFQEIPGEITLAVNLSNCPNRCPGCHSPYLWEDKGFELNEASILELLKKYGDSITCFSFMGGDSEPQEVERLSLFIKNKTLGKIKTGWYSGKTKLANGILPDSFDYIKIGPYIESLGGLSSPTTNQRLYKIEGGNKINITSAFQNKIETHSY